MHANAKVLAVARKEIGVSEQPAGSNLGPRVNQYKAETWLPASKPWPWCVALWQWVIKQALGRKFPYETAATWELARYCREHKLTTDRPIPGDAAILGAEHMTFLVRFAGDYIIGLGGNQRNQVNESRYPRSRVTTWVSTQKVAEFLDVPEPKPKPKRPLYEVVRGEGETVTVYTGRNPKKIGAKVAQLVNAGRKKILVRPKRKRP